jgi:hypothetical protein
MGRVQEKLCPLFLQKFANGQIKFLSENSAVFRRKNLMAHTFPRDFFETKKSQAEWFIFYKMAIVDNNIYLSTISYDSSFYIHYF